MIPIIFWSWSISAISIFSNTSRSIGKGTGMRLALLLEMDGILFAGMSRGLGLGLDTEESV